MLQIVEVETKVIDLLRKELKTTDVDAASEVGTPYQWDSLKHIAIMLKIEQEFEIQVGAAFVARLNSVKAITEFVYSYCRK